MLFQAREAPVWLGRPLLIQAAVRPVTERASTLALIIRWAAWALRPPALHTT